MLFKLIMFSKKLIMFLIFVYTLRIPVDLSFNSAEYNFLQNDPQYYILILLRNYI